MKSTPLNVTQSRATRLIDERMTITRLHENMLAQAESREENRGLTEIEHETLAGYAQRAEEIDKELQELGDTLEREKRSADVSNLVRKHLAGGAAGMTMEDGQVKYRSFAVYARDILITKHGETFRQIAELAGGNDVVAAARERLLHRAPEHTLSSDVEGLQPEQHIAQIFQVIDSSRPLVASAQRIGLQRGRLTFPKVTGKPTVDIQEVEKQGPSTGKLQVEMEDATATTFLGAGNLSWQTIEWSTPDALDLWFRLCAADYALKTEQDAAHVVADAGFQNQIGTPLTGTDSYEDWVAAIVAGAGDVYANSGRIADTIYLAPDQFYAFSALIPSGFSAAFVNGGVSLAGQTGQFAGMNMVMSRGLNAGVAVVGDRQGLLVAETPGAPVQLRVVEPAIGGLEVGIIGAFEAVAVEDEAFALITSAS